MDILSDFKVLYHLGCKRIRGTTHAERMESFYAGQAAGYDRFRQRLLPGRAELVRSIPLKDQAVWVDLGGGTGANLEFLGPGRESLKRFEVVDVAASLLRVAQQRAQEHGWEFVVTRHHDATTYRPDEQVDVVTFSYSLTMIPDWITALQNAWRMLKPGGHLGVVDFYISRKYPQPGRTRHGWWTRSFWPVWFALDNVHLSSDHLPQLTQQFQLLTVAEAWAKIPYVPWGYVPTYRFVGRKRSGVASDPDGRSPGESES